ncbi:hypothetical protein YB2330_004696 [Saitoella coloradoensis]
MLLRRRIAIVSVLVSISLVAGIWSIRPASLRGEGLMIPSKAVQDCPFCARHFKGRVIYEDDELIAFHDRSPAASYHALIIPREHIISCKSLTPAHLPLLHRMISIAHDINPRKGEEGYIKPRIGFHVPPVNSVAHLHLHVIVPPWKPWWKRMKYPMGWWGWWGWWFEPVEKTIERVERLEAASQTQLK